MKKTIKFATIVLLAALTTACDPGYNEDMVIRNESSHTVTVIPGIRDCATSNPNYSVENNTYSIAPNREVVIQSTGGIGGASLEEGVASFLQYYGDSVAFRFAGDTILQMVYYRNDTLGISPYNFQGIHYQYEEKRNTGRWFHDHPSYGKLTFVISDEHYDAEWGWASKSNHQ